MPIGAVIVFNIFGVCAITCKVTERMIKGISVPIKVIKYPNFMGNNFFANQVAYFAIAKVIKKEIVP